MLKTDAGMFDLPKLTAHRLSAVRKKDGKMKRMRELTHDARIRSSAYRDR